MKVGLRTMPRVPVSVSFPRLCALVSCSSSWVSYVDSLWIVVICPSRTLLYVLEIGAAYQQRAEWNIIVINVVVSGAQWRDLEARAVELKRVGNSVAWENAEAGPGALFGCARYIGVARLRILLMKLSIYGSRPSGSSQINLLTILLSIELV